MHTTIATSLCMLLCEFILLLQCAYITLIFTVPIVRIFILRLLFVSKFITPVLQLALGSPKGGEEELEFSEI
jgi:hypothetical protein